MALININTFQDGVNKSSLLTSYTDEYIKSVINLGQRTGVKGDGLESGQFIALDIMGTVSTSLSDISNYYIRASYNVSDNVVKFQLYDAVDKKLVGSVLSVSINNIYNPDADIRLSTFGGTDRKWYAGRQSDGTNYGLIKKYDDRYYINFKAQVSQGTATYDTIVVEEISCDGVLLRGIICTNTDGTERTFIIEPYVKEGVENHYTITRYLNSTVSVSQSISDIYSDIKGDLYEDVLKYVTYDKSSKSEVIVKYDGEQFKPIIVTSEDFADVCERLSYHIKPWFKEVISIYNKNVYFKNYDNRSLKQHIIANIVKGTYDYIGANGNYVGSDLGYGMYFPVGYVFDYYANSNDDTQIYTSSHPVYIYYRGDFDVDATFNPLDIPGCILADSGIDKTVGFNFSIDYIDNIVSKISSNKDRVLPYINGDGYWVIDDNLTAISGVGKNAGQPNIIITKSEYKDKTLTGTVIYCASFNGEDCVKKLNGLGTTNEKLWYRLPQAQKNEGYNTNANRIELTSVLPTLKGLDNDETTKYILENALIISLITVDENQNLKDELSSGFVPTVWSVTKNNNIYSYKYLTTKGLDDYGHDDIANYALDVNDFINLENYVNNILKSISSEPDKNLFKHIVFTSLSVKYKQTLGQNKTLYPTIRNKSLRTDDKDDNEYIDRLENIGNVIHPYNNPLNTEIEFTDGVEFNSDGVSKINRNSTKKAFTLIEKMTIDGGTSYFIEDVVPYNNYPEEMIPNGKELDNVYPTINLKEVFIQNQNTLNRTNVIGVVKADNYGRIYDGVQSYLGRFYYGYFGVSPTSPDRDVLRIGTSTHDINMGTAALTYTKDTESLQKFDKLSVDIQNTVFPYDVTFGGTAEMQHPVWHRQSVLGYNIYSSTFTPTGLEDKGRGLDDELFTTYMTIDIIGDNEYKYLFDDFHLSYMFVEKEISYINVDKLIRKAGISYTKYPIYYIDADPEKYFPADNRYQLSTGLRPFMSFAWLPTAYTCNPISISYMNGDPKMVKYYDTSYQYIYGFHRANAYTKAHERWTCDGCSECIEGAGECSYRGVCKYTTLKYADAGMSSSYSWENGFSTSPAVIREKNKTISFYSKWAALKLEKGYVDPEWPESYYDIIARTYPDTYSFSYYPEIMPTGGGNPELAYTPGNYSYYGRETVEYVSYSYTAYINFREIETVVKPVVREITYAIDYYMDKMLLYKYSCGYYDPEHPVPGGTWEPMNN